jgi:hypothetical protein
MQAYSFSQLLFAAATALGLGLLGVGAPGGRYLVGTPSVEKVVRDPSVRTGSSHVHHWYSVGGGYHGGK